MNTPRIFLAGLVSGLVMNVLDFITNVPLFGARWSAAYKALGLSESPAIPLFWISFDFINGVLIAFMYAAMLPRFGPGPKNGLIAGALAWTFVHLALFSHLADGVFPADVLLYCGALELVSASVGGLIVSKLYREEERTRAAAMG
jgi:hypothetical protein